MTFKYFKLEDFACKHCGKNLIAPDFVAKLDRLRETVGFALIVSSGYRCAVHNAAVSTTGQNGPHTTGRAADLAVSRHAAFWLLEAAMTSGEFSGVGVQQKGTTRFIHLDDLTEPEHAPRPSVWSY